MNAMTTDPHALPADPEQPYEPLGAAEPPPPPPEDAVKFTRAAALWTSLIAGFLILAQSDFKLNRDLGMFTSLTFALALIVDFLLLPWLLLRFVEPQSRSQAAHGN